MLLAPLDLRKEEVGLLFRLPELAQLKKKRTFLRVQSGSFGTAAIPDFHTFYTVGFTRNLL